MKAAEAPPTADLTRVDSVLRSILAAKHDIGLIDSLEAPEKRMLLSVLDGIDIFFRTMRSHLLHEVSGWEDISYLRFRETTDDDYE